MNSKNLRISALLLCGALASCKSTQPPAACLAMPIPGAFVTAQAEGGAMRLRLPAHETVTWTPDCASIRSFALTYRWQEGRLLALGNGKAPPILDASPVVTISSAQWGLVGAGAGDASVRAGISAVKGHQMILASLDIAKGNMPETEAIHAAAVAELQSFIVEE